MSKITAALAPTPDDASELIDSLSSSDDVSEVLLMGHGAAAAGGARTRRVECDLLSGRGLNALLRQCTTEYLAIVKPGERVRLGPNALRRMLSVAEDSGAGLTYADFRDEQGDKLTDHPLTDYQPGSIRDNFDFGPLMLLSKDAIDSATSKHGAVDERLRWGSLYDLRLKLSIDSQLLRIPEPLYIRTPIDVRASGERQFDYVDPGQREYQAEMERVATGHLKRVGAFLEPKFGSLHALGGNKTAGAFPVSASVVIPVRNRERTIEDAVKSALSQQADFEFNVIVVDNHSTDRTTEILVELAKRDRRVVHLRPARFDLGIGGCWNEAIFSEQCGEYAVQLDSDDLYADSNSLAAIVATFARGEYAMVIGSYTIVNFDLHEIPPGLIDHREWTRENGRNNALRINGLGAPRAFWVPLLRRIGGLPNTSYGEDYATALRISREYEIGRVYDSIYYARRWEGNSDAALPIATANRYDAYKDYLRTLEISARRKLNGA